MSIVDTKVFEAFDLGEFIKTKLPLLRATWPKLMAEDLCSVQPMTIPKMKFVKAEEFNWNRVYKPYIPLIVHEYPEEKWLKDEDFFV